MSYSSKDNKPQLYLERKQKNKHRNLVIKKNRNLLIKKIWQNWNGDSCRLRVRPKRKLGEIGALEKSNGSKPKAAAK